MHINGDLDSPIDRNLKSNQLPTETAYLCGFTNLAVPLSPLLKGFLKVLLFAGLLALALLAVQATGLSRWLHPAVWWLLLINLLMAVGIQLMVDYGVYYRQGQFQIFYLAGSVIRLFVSGLVAFAFIYVGTPAMETFVLNFFALYLLFVGFEIYSVLGNLRSDSKSGPKSWK